MLQLYIVDKQARDGQTFPARPAAAAVVSCHDLPVPLLCLAQSSIILPTGQSGPLGAAADNCRESFAHLLTQSSNELRSSCVSSRSPWLSPTFSSSASINKRRICCTQRVSSSRISGGRALTCSG